MKILNYLQGPLYIY